MKIGGGHYYNHDQILHGGGAKESFFTKAYASTPFNKMWLQKARMDTF